MEAIASKSGQTLVSAAAGSGKTHVLSHRIEALVRGADLDAFAEDDGTQVCRDRMEKIENMLVMTFSRMAAAQMRDRIVTTITNAADAQRAEGNNEDAEILTNQAEAAAGADISTVHSFCARVIADHYELAEVCAGFGILSEEQASQLKEAAVREVFEERYEAEDARIEKLLRKFTEKGQDFSLMEKVIRVYGQMMSTPDWEEWLTRPLGDDWNDSIAQTWDKLCIQELENAAELMRLAAEITEQEAADLNDKKLMDKAVQDRTWADRFDQMARTARDVSVDAALKDIVTKPIRFASTDKIPGALATAQELRKDVRSTIARIRSVQRGDEGRRMLEEAHGDLELFVDLVRDFAAKYVEKKRAVNKLDYNDLEHKALQVLSKLSGTDESYARRYRHVFVDEYQDTNKVQESILQELTSDDNHIFMVGDLKQSIYGFRFADPSIFRSKDSEFSRPENDTQKLIHMNDNFRSAPAVITTVNAVMERLMKETFGGVNYNENEALRAGLRSGEPGHAQILIARAQPEDTKKGAELKDESEAVMIATRIEELINSGWKPSDIAILMRSRSDRVNAIEEQLEKRGIPYYAQLDSNKTFTELDVFLNLLELVVNERRDVPLLAVMRSYMFGFDEADFARIVNWNDSHPERDDGQHRPKPFFYKLRRYRDAGRGGKFNDDSDQALFERIEHFFADLEELRVMGTDMALGRFAEETGAKYDFGEYLLTRPAGASRKMAYDKLIATIGEQQEIHGNSLYRVLQAVRKIRDTGTLEANAAAADTNAVRITTIHKSKGLEYPIVFVASLDKGFNTSSTQGLVLTSDEYGVTMKNVDEQTHLTNETMESMVVKRYLQDSQKSEELRTLYVAMTRAKKQLYLCGADADEEKSMRRWKALKTRHGAAKSLLDWVMAACLELSGDTKRLTEVQSRELADLENLRELKAKQQEELSGRLADAENRAVRDDLKRQIASLTLTEEEQNKLDGLRKLDVLSRLYSGSFWEPGQRVGNDESGQAATGSLDPLQLIEQAQQNGGGDIYGLPKRERQPAVQGVSKRVVAERGSDSRKKGVFRMPVLPEPADSTLKGAERGTLLHRALRYAVQNRLHTDEIVPAMLVSRLVSDDEAAELEKNMYAIDAFFDSDLYKRAAASEKVFTEQPFELLLNVPGEDNYYDGKMRLRGMIDLAFIEDGEWVLVDYKSDRGADSSELAERYAEQIGYYRQALETLSGMNVKESYLFSLERQEAIPVGF